MLLKYMAAFDHLIASRPVLVLHQIDPPVRLKHGAFRERIYIGYLFADHPLQIMVDPICTAPRVHDGSPPYEKLGPHCHRDSPLPKQLWNNFGTARSLRRGRCHSLSYPPRSREGHIPSPAPKPRSSAQILAWTSDSTITFTGTSPEFSVHPPASALCTPLALPHGRICLPLYQNFCCQSQSPSRWTAIPAY